MVMKKDGSKAEAGGYLAVYPALYEPDMGVEFAQFPSKEYTGTYRTDVLFYAICQAELDNEISANMGTQQKNLLKPIVETSEVKKLYKSVLSQINTQKKIKEAHYQDRKRKNKLIVDLLLAVFSANSLYKTVMDLVKGSFSWMNWVIFGAMMLVYCTVHIQQNSLPNSPSDCVGFNRRCHRIASFSRLAVGKLFVGFLPNMNGTVH